MANSNRTSMSIAFLDVLSCGLGASILLFFIFTTLEHAGDRSSRSDSGLETEADTIDATLGGDELLRSATLYWIEATNLDGAEVPGLLVEGLKEDEDDEHWASISLQSENSGAAQATFLLLVRGTETEGKVAVTPKSSRVRIVFDGVAGAADASGSFVLRSQRGTQADIRYAAETLTSIGQAK